MRIFVTFLLLAGFCLAQHSSQNEPFDTVFWMHIQKTSSWLGNFLLLWGCSTIREDSQKFALFTADSMMHTTISTKIPELKCEKHYYTGKFGYGYHIPYPTNMNHTTITLVRNPYNRVISAFMYGKGIHQIMFPKGFPNRAKVKFQLRDMIRKSEFPILTYANLPGISSCQIKMILGKECGEVLTLTINDINEAKRRIHSDFYFIGLTEESEASARLFLAMYPINYNHFIQNNHNMNQNSHQNNNENNMEKSNNIVNNDILVSTLKLAPRMNIRHNNSMNDQYLSVLKVHNWKDYPDEEIYKETVVVFYERCKYYYIQTQYTAEQLLSLLI